MSWTLPLTNVVATGAVIESLGWTLLHFVWQAAVIALLVGLVLMLMTKRTAVARYWVSGTGLAAMAACPLVTFVLLLNTSLQPANELAPFNDDNGAHPIVDRSPESPAASAEINSSFDTTEIAAPSESSAPVMPDESVGQPIGAQTPNAFSISAIWTNLAGQVRSVAPWLVAVWLAGVLVMSVRLLSGWLGVHRLTRHGVSDLEPHLQQQVKNLSRRLGIRRSVRLLESVSVNVPTVIGWLKPVILLPTAALTGLRPEDLSAILAHELAHVRRGDYLVNLIQSMLETVLFYHPAVWWLSARVRTERENCCDDLAASVSGGARPYARALLELEQIRPAPKLALGADGGDLVSRISRLLGRVEHSDKSRPLWLAAVGSLAIAGAAFSSVWIGNETTAAHGHGPNTRVDQPQEPIAGAGTDPVNNQDDDEDRSMSVVVLGPDGQSMEGVNVHAGIWTKDRAFGPNQTLFTDQQGRVTVMLPEEFYILRLWARAAGHAPLFSNWEENEINSGDLPPDEYVFKMIPGVKIGGVVNNEKGEPIAGAQVQVSGSATHPDDARRPRYGTWYAEGAEAVMTDEAGRWSLDNLPPADDLSVRVLLTHPDYIDDETWGGLQTAQGIKTAQFLDQSATIAMSKGVAVTGEITTPDGLPVDEGLVIWGDDPYFQQGSQEVRIVEGTFELPPLAPGSTRITVVAPGWSPQSKVVDIQPMMETVDFELTEGNTLSVLVVDEQDNPLPGAWVQVGHWRGAQALYNHQHPNVQDTRIPFRADDGGLYRWTWAPDDDVTFHIGVEGYSMRRGVVLRATDETHVVKLDRPSSIAGDVFDKTTGERIENFTVIPVFVSQNADGSPRIREQHHNAQASRNGRFRIQLQTVVGGNGVYRLRFVSPGYAPLETDSLTMGSGRARFELQPQAWPRGRVLDAAGNPLANAMVHLTTGRQVMSIRNFTDTDESSAFSVTSHTDGFFEFPPMNSPYTLIAAHDKGYAEVVYQPDQPVGDIQLQPWAAIEGHVVDELGNPVAGLTIIADPVRYQYGNSFHIQHWPKSATDQDGFYRIENMPPMTYGIRTVSHMHDGMLNRFSVPAQLKPGETTTLDMGTGIPVKGRFQLTGHDGPIDYSQFHNMIVPIAPPPYGLPSELAQLNIYDWRDGWSGYRAVADEDFQKSRPLLLSQLYVTAGVNPDGTFLFHLPQSGQFDMAIMAKGHHPNSSGILAGLMGERVHRFSVDPDADTNSPVDLGVVEVAAFPKLKIGDAMPQISLTTGKGETLQLDSFRGKTVLLDFWCPWCEVCKADKPGLSELATRLVESGDENKVIVSAEMPGSGDPNRIWRGDRENWLGGQLSRPDSERLYQQLGIYSLPRYLIVDPDGKLVYHGNLAGAVEALDN